MEYTLDLEVKNIYTIPKNHIGTLVYVEFKNGVGTEGYFVTNSSGQLGFLGLDNTTIVYERKLIPNIVSYKVL